MKLHHSLLWLAAPILAASMVTQAAPGEQMQQMDQDNMHEIDNDKMQQKKSAEMQDCTGMKGMDRSGMDMNDPAVQEKMQKCMKMMHGDKMMGDQMQGDEESPETGESMQMGGDHDTH